MDSPTPTKPTVAVKIGSLSLQGGAAIAALVAMLLLIVSVIYASHPSLRMLSSGAIWIAFIIYWSIQALKAAPATRAESKESRRFHEILLNGSLLLLFVPVPGLRERFLPLNKVVVAIGFALQIASALLGVWARRHLGRNWSGAISSAEGHQLIRSGPYRSIRHPIYSAMIGMGIGTTIISGELHALIAAVILVGAYWRKMRLEEQHLRTLFEDEYEAYSRETSALVPWLP